MLTVEGAYDALKWLATKAIAGDAAGWDERAAWLSALSGREWLLLDDLARTVSYGQAPIGGTAGWLGPHLPEPTGLVAAVTSLHTDGRMRQRATRLLATVESRLAAPALAVRSLDHVEQVREEALRGLRALPVDQAPVVLSVLLAGRRRQHANAALDVYLESVLQQAAPSEVLAALREADDRNVQRWAYRVSYERGLLSVADLFDVVRSGRDQPLRASCAHWLRGRASVDDLRALLAARFVDGRMLAVQDLPDEALPDTVLLPLLADASGRVRELAQWRARRRGTDVADWYRHQMQARQLSPRRTAACLAGLADCGSSGDVPLVLARLTDDSPSVRAEAVAAVSSLAAADGVRNALLPLLHDPAPKVSAAAARALARTGAGTAEAAPAWESALVTTRRAAWRLSRAAGTWERVDADVRAAADPDPQLAGLGLAGLRNWLHAGAATTWGRPRPETADRLLRLLPLTGLTLDEQRLVAFHSGLGLPTSARGGGRDAGRTWLRLLRRR